MTHSVEGAPRPASTSAGLPVSHSAKPAGSSPAKPSAHPSTGDTVPPLPRRRGRPPRDRGDADPDTRRLLIRTGLIALTEKGYCGVGIDEILRTAGVPKGSFYHYFDSKESFGNELITAYADYFAARLDRWFLDTSLSPLDRLRGFIRDASHSMKRHDFRRGCLVGNLGQEMAALPPSFRARIIAIFVDWQRRTERCLRAACNAGQIAPTMSCRALAELFWIGWEGAVLRAKLEGHARPLDRFGAGFLSLLHPLPHEAAPPSTSSPSSSHSPSPFTSHPSP